MLDNPMNLKFQFTAYQKYRLVCALFAGTMALPVNAQTTPAANAPVQKGSEVVPAVVDSAAPGVSSDKVAVERLHQTTLAILQALVEKGILTSDAVEALLDGAAAKAKTNLLALEKRALQAGKPAEVVRVPYVPEIVKREMRDQIRQEVLAQAKSERWGEPGATPEWLDRIQVEGDVRVRLQSDRFAKSNPQPSELFDSEDITNFAGLTNSNKDENRYRVRARLGVSARVAQDVGAGIRLSTGSQNGPVSTSSTAGDPNNRYAVKIDRAYIRYSPYQSLTFDAGRITNPFFSTELLYAPDLGFDGLAASFRPIISEKIKPFATVGLFPIRHSAAASDRVMRAIQIGTQFQPTDQLGFRIGLANYNYRNAPGTPLVDRLDPAYNASEYESGFRQRGNTLFRINQDPFVTAAPVYGLASKFNVQALTASVEVALFDPIRLNFTAESITNKGFNPTDVADRVGFTGIEKRNRGNLLRVTAGNPTVSEARDWQISFGIRKLERDATLDAYTDPDFVLGGTNVKGQTFSISYGLSRNTVLGFRFLSGRTIDPPISNPLAEPLRVKTMQMDMNVKF
jgi:Putative porin